MIVRSTMWVLLSRTQINSPMIVRSTMGVLLPRTQINSMLRDVTWRDATLFTSSPVVELFWNFWIIWVKCPGSYSCWTNFYAPRKNKNLKKRGNHFLVKHVYDHERFKIQNVINIPIRSSIRLMVNPFVIISSFVSRRPKLGASRLVV